MQVTNRYSSLMETYIKDNVLNKEFSILSKDTDAFFILNIDGSIAYINQVFNNYLTDTINNIENLRLEDLFKEDTLNNTRTFFMNKDQEMLCNFDTQILYIQGKPRDINLTIFPVLFHSEIIGSYVVVKDISVTKWERQSKEVRDKHHDQLVDLSPETIIIIKDTTIVHVNQEGLHMLGATKEDLVGKSIYQFIETESINEFTEKLKQVYIGEITDLFEQKFIKLDGNVLDVEVKVFPTLFKSEQASHIIVRDISEKKKLSFISEKQAVAGQLAAGIAHEIRNPITAIKGFLQLMLGDYEGDKKYLNIIESEIARIEVILKELMILAKPSKLKYERLNIHNLLEQVLTLMESQALLNNTQVKTNYNFSSASVIGDANQIKQVFINYIKNGIEAMPNGGQLFIEGNCQLDGNMVIRFIDQGKGIPPEILNRIGEPFFTTKEYGTGLGMLVSSQIIEEHNGSVAINSSDKGTCIEVTLPIVA